MRFTWSVAYVLLYVYRLIILIGAETIVSGFTTLGDAHRYQRGGTSLENAFENGSTSLTQAIGSIFRSLIGSDAFLINIGFMTMGFSGILVFLRSLPPRYRQLALPFMILPSFNLWTSIASKESIILCAAGFFAAGVAQIMLGYQRVQWWFFLAVPVLIYYKPQYAPSLIFLMAVTFIPAYVRQPALIVLIGGIISLLLLVPFAQTIGELAIQIPAHFIGDGSGLSTREAFWTEWIDVFTKAPEGIWLAFFGPKISEASSGHLMHVFSFAESTLLIFMIAVVIGNRLLDRPAHLLLSLLFSLFWLLFANYPLGVMNPGTAVRYRAGYYILIVLILILTSSKEADTRRNRWRTTDA